MDSYILIIGAMKSGTTSLFATLAQHPQIAPAHPKEPGFFAFEDVNAQGLDWYQGLFDFDTEQHTYRLDGSTDYTKVPFVSGVRDRMAAIPNARFKLIYVMRHPLRRIESHARHVQRTRKEIGQHISPRADHGLDTGVSLESLAIGRYAEQLDTYADVFDAGDLFLTSLEELKENPDDTLASLFKFLELPPPSEKVEVARKNVGRERVALSSSWAKLTSNRTILAAVKQVLPKHMRDKLKSRFQRKAVVVEGRFKLTDAEEEILLSLLADDLARLQTRYGFDVERLWGLRGRTL